MPYIYLFLRKKNERIKEPKNENDKNLNKQMNDKERLEASNLNKNIIDFYSEATIDTEEYLNFLKS